MHRIAPAISGRTRHRPDYAEPVSHPSLLCIHAHPDDEALWTGGVLVRCAELGGRTSVVTCTWPPGSERAGELQRSLRILNAGAPRLLGYADLGVTDTTEDYRSFCDAPFDELVESVVTHIRAFRPDTVLTYDPMGVYGHPDHIQTHRVAVAAIGAAGYPQLYPEAGPPWRPKILYQASMPFSAAQLLWPAVSNQANRPVGSLPGVPDEEIDLFVDVTAWLHTKWDALSAHQSEIARGGAMTMLAALPDDLRWDVLRTEWFQRMDLEPDAEAFDALRFPS